MELRRMRYGEFVALLATMSITIAAAIDVMLPAFDEMKASLGMAADSNAIALTVSVYFAGMAVAQPFFGPLADHYGRKPVLYAGLAVYALGAAGSAFAPSFAVLLLSRFVWGIGAGSLRVLFYTIPRDVFEGDRMARVLSLVMAVFLVGPIVAPLIGEALVRLGSWRYVFAVGAVVGAATLLWSFRLDETLDPADRLPLGFARTVEAFRAVITTRETLGYAVALTFIFGILLTFLASSALLFDAVYERSGQFAVLFSVLSLVSAGAAYTNARAVERIGADRVMRFGAIGLAASGAAITAVSLASGGRPPFWLWYVLLAVILGHVSVLLPTGSTVAMGPMGHLAGTASAVIGTLTLGGGLVLGGLIDSTLQDSVTPMSVGFLTYGILAIGAVFWARPGWRRSRFEPSGWSDTVGLRRPRKPTGDDP